MLSRYYWSKPPAAAAPGFDTLVLALTNLRAYWKLEDSGATMADASASALNGSYTGSPTQLVTGPLTSTSYGVTFNGSSQYGSVSHNAAMNLGTSDFSVGMWIKDSSWPTASAEHYLLSHDGDGDAGTWAAYQAGEGADDINLRLGGSLSAWHAGSTLGDGNWHLIGWTIDRDSSTGGKEWVDGSNVGSSDDVSSYSATALDATKTLYVARRTTTGYASVTLSRIFFTASLMSAGDWSALWAAR